MSHKPAPNLQVFPIITEALQPFVVSTSPNAPAFMKLSSDSSKDAFATGPVISHFIPYLDTETMPPSCVIMSAINIMCLAFI